jgi:hypothetical protein
MNPMFSLLLVIMQAVPAEAPSREVMLTVACSVAATSSLTDSRPGQQPLTLLKFESEFSSKRHLTVDTDTVSVRYDEVSCRSLGQESGCPEGLLIADHTLTVKIPASGADFQLTDITWPPDWTERERNFALTDLPLILSIASSTSQSSSVALTEGLLNSVPGATLKANEPAAAVEIVSGQFQGTGVNIPLSGAVKTEEGRVTLEAEGISPKEANSMGQTRQDKVSIVCTRESSRAETRN